MIRTTTGCFIKLLEIVKIEIINNSINYAIQLLKQHPNYTIRAIADEAGFNSTPILYSMFKKKTGMTPYEFKKAQESLG